MAQLLLIGGLGGHSSQIVSVADALSRHYEQEVIGIAFSEAQKDLAYVAQLARDSIVITHSSGIVLCEDITPREIIAIAPSVPSSMPVATWRGIMKTVGLIKSGYTSPERRQRIHTYHSRALREHITQPIYNLGQAAKVCHFDPAELAIKMINRGVTVTLGFMDQDLLYPKSARHVHVDMARRHGAIVHEGIKGHHDEFLLYPLKILEHLNRF